MEAAVVTAANPTLPTRPLVLADLIPGAWVRDAALVLTAALFTALLAQIEVPVPGSPVPISGQTLGVVLTAAALGPVRGAAGQALYVLMGAVGLPFYSGGDAGFSHLVGPTGGYLVGFVLAGYLVGLAARHGLDRAPWKALPLFVAGQTIIFALGVPWLAAVANLSLGDALEQGLYPFIIGGLLKAAIAGAVMTGAWQLIRRNHPRGPVT